MKIREESLPDWTQMEVKLLADEATGQEFHRYFVFWAETAEKLLEEKTEDEDGNLLGPIEAVRKALQITENELGNLHLHFIGQMLVYFISYWEFGENLHERMTMIELKVIHATLQEEQVRKTLEASEKG